MVTDHHERGKRRRISPQTHGNRHDGVKIKREAFEASTHKLHKADVTDIEDEIEVLRRKKLKLLRDSDWLGLHLQEPVKLKYAPTGVDDNIGRRRRLKPGHEARYEKQHMHSSPARCGYDVLSQVRVAIDGKERRVGIRSSAAPSQGRAPPPISSQTSEPMLLEGRLGSEVSYLARGQSESRQHGRHRSDSHRADHTAQNAYTGEPDKYEGEAAPPWENLGRLATASIKQPRLHETAPSFSSSSIRKRAEELGCAPYDDGSGENYKSLFSISSPGDPSSQQLPLLPRHVRPDPVVKNDDARKKGRLIMPSSSPVLHHPVPRRATSKVLRSNSLDIASSIAATVGVVPKQPETAKKEDEMWKNWLDEDAASGSDAGPGPDEMDEEHDRQRSITPGVSEYVPRQSPVQESERSITPGVSEYVPQRFAAEVLECLQGSRSSGPCAESAASGTTSNGILAHNAMRMSSSVNSTTMSASRTPSARPQVAFNNVGQAAMAKASSVLAGSPRPEFRPRISLLLPDIRVTQRVDDDTAWKTFLQSPSELRFDAESPRPCQKPPVRRPTKQEKLKPKTPDPDAAWKSFVLTNDSDSEGENPAFNSFWKKNERQPAQAKPMGTGQTMIEGFFKPPQKLHAKAPLGARGQKTFKRPVPFGTPQKARKESFVDGLDKKYVQDANKELRTELWGKKANGDERDDGGKGKGKERQTKSIWDIPSSDDDYIEDS